MPDASRLFNLENPTKNYFLVDMIFPSRSLIFLFLAVIIPFIGFAQKNVLTQHYDLNRTGWFNQETTLTARNVKPGAFGKLFSRTVDDQIYAQPLVVQLNVPGVGTRNVMIVATVNNSLYAFDADSAKVSAPYWQVSLNPAGSRAIKNTDMTGACGGGYRDFSGNMGIVGTPVIDPATNTLYIVARSVNSSNQFAQYLHAIDLSTGNEKSSSPVLITATVNGVGDGSVNGKITFDPQKQNQRPGLLLFNGVVYIAWASHCDWGPYHGWLMGYDATTLQQLRVYNTTPDGYNGGIWMSGAGPSMDENGNIYVAVGNGSVGKNGNYSDPTNRSESALKLTPNGSGFTLATYFTPKNIADLEASDLDFGVTEVMLIPGTNRALVGCKDGNIYLLNRDAMGGFSSTSNNVLQTINLGTNAHLRSSFAYYKGSQKEFVYTWSENSLLKALPYDRSGTGIFDLANTISSPAQGPIGNNGALLSVSSNGSIDSTAVLWTSYAANGDANQSVRPGILRAFDATDVTKELWNSSFYSTDNPGNYAKFNCPVVANGKVYLATFSNQLIVYGLLSQSTSTCSSTNIGLNKSTTASSTISGTTANAVDGNVSTVWTSGGNDNQSFTIDLAARYDLCKINLTWGSLKGSNFSMQVSDDNQNWTTLVVITGNTSTILPLSVLGTGRYVRMLGTLGQGGYSIAEFEVYGTLSQIQCATPYLSAVTNVYDNSATLNWISAATNFIVQYKTVSAGNWTSTTATTNTLTLNGLACGTDYLFRLRTVCAVGDSSNYASGSFSTLACNQNCSPLPTRWSTLDIGDIDAAGSACFSNGVFTVRGSGNDIWDTEDGFRYAYKTFVGDGEMSARVVSFDNTSPWNKVGIMFRESITPGSRHAFVAVTSNNGVAFQNRTTTDGYSNNVNTGPGIGAPVWLKLTKSGSVYTAYESADGKTWTRVGDPVAASFGDGTPVYVGFAITSHNNGILSTAILDNLFITGAYEYALQTFTTSLNLDKTVNVQWTTTLESNVLKYVIERSTDMTSFTKVDSTSAVNQGHFTQNYSRQDSPSGTGYFYYRLKMITSDGIIKYSTVSAVYVSSNQSPSVFPNPAPATGSQTFSVAQGDENEPVKFVNLYDINGRNVAQFSSSSTNGITELNISNLSNGVYTVEIITNRSTYKTKLVIRN